MPVGPFDPLSPRSKFWHDDYRRQDAREMAGLGNTKRRTAAAKDPFDVDLTDEERTTLGEWLVNQIEAAYNARVSIIGPNGDLDYAHWMYEQGRTPVKAKRWPGAADLNSYLVCEKVDALRSRVVKTIFSEPFAVVEGWGQDAQKAPFVEEFHTWKRRDERLRWYLSKAIHNALIEQNGILEILDRADVRLNRQLQRFAAKVNDQDGSTLLDDQNQPIVDLDENGAPMPEQPDRPVIEAQTSTYQSVRRGPGYRVVSQRDFLFLPGHAADKSEIYGYAKRCYYSLGQLKELVTQKVYDADAVEKLGTGSERTEIQPGLDRAGQTLQSDLGDESSEKELWSVLFLKDLDGDGLREWYIATVSLVDRVLLRVKHDNLGNPRFLDFTPFPRPDSVYGYSFVLDKLSTIAEEHTATRNMNADRSLLATTPPVLVQQGALWDPNEQPWGTGAVIHVRDMREIQPITVPDVPASSIQREGMILQAAERVSGLNDTAVGVQPQEQRTLGEVEIVAQSGAVRVEEIVENIQETLEILDQVRHEIWIRTLEAQPNGAMEAPDSVVREITTRGLEIADGAFTADMLRGNFRFLPHGSVETADRNRMRADFNGSLQALGGLGKMFPGMQGVFMSPDVIKAILMQWARLYNVPDRQPFLKALAQPMMMPGLPAGMAPPPGMEPAGAPAPPMAGGPGGIEQLLQALPPEIAQLLMAPQQGGVQ